MDGINARHTTTNRDPGDGTDITTTWKLTTSQVNNNNNKACPVGTRDEVANMWREASKRSLVFPSFYLLPGFCGVEPVTASSPKIKNHDFITGFHRITARCT